MFGGERERDYPKSGAEAHKEHPEDPMKDTADYDYYGAACNKCNNRDEYGDGYAEHSGEDKPKELNPSFVSRAVLVIIGETAVIGIAYECVRR